MKFKYEQINPNIDTVTANAIAANSNRAQNTLRSWMTTAAYIMQNEQREADRADQLAAQQAAAKERTADREAIAKYRADQLALEQQKLAATKQTALAKNRFYDYVRTREAAAQNAPSAPTATAPNSNLAANANETAVAQGKATTALDLTIPVGKGLNKPTAPSAADNVEVPALFHQPQVELSKKGGEMLKIAAQLPLATKKTNSQRPSGAGIYGNKPASNSSLATPQTQTPTAPRRASTLQEAYKNQSPVSRWGYKKNNVLN